MAKHEMQIMGRDGHRTMTWDKSDKASVVSAGLLFDELVGKGYRAFRDNDGKEDGPMKSFNPDASEIIMTTPLVGG